MSEAITSKEQLQERFEFWMTTNGYNSARELSAFVKGGRRRIYVNPTVELAWQVVEALHAETIAEPLAHALRNLTPTVDSPRSISRRAVTA